MNTKIQQALMIGTFMKEAEIEKFTGYKPLQYNKVTSNTLREICVARGYFSAKAAKKLTFWRFAFENAEKLTDPKGFLFDSLASGNAWCPEVSVDYIAFKQAVAAIDYELAFGGEIEEEGYTYVNKIHQKLGDNLKRIQY